MSNTNPAPLKSVTKKPQTGPSASPVIATNAKDSDLSDHQSQGSSGQGGVTDTVKETANKAAEALARGRDTIGEAASDAAHRAGDMYDGVRNEIERAYDEGYHQGRALIAKSRQRTGTFVRENPLAVCALGFAGGLLLGALLPRTSTEDRYIGHYRDDIADRAKDLGEQSLRQGREKAEQALHAASGTVRETVERATNSVGSDG